MGTARAWPSSQHTAPCLLRLLPHADLPLASGELGHLALLPHMQWLSLAGTAAEDVGVSHLLGTPLRHLDLRCATGALLLRMHALRPFFLALRSCLAHCFFLAGPGRRAATRVSDASWPALAQLPLEWLDLSGTAVKCASWPEGALHLLLRLGMQQIARLPPRLLLSLAPACCTARPAGLGQLPPMRHLTSLRLLQSAVDDRGARHLAAALPELRELHLGSPAVGDKGLRALCTLPKVGWRRCRRPPCVLPAVPQASRPPLPPPACMQLERLRLEGAQWATDAGLLKALPRCSTLRHLDLQGCWLTTEAGLQAAAAAALAAGGGLQEVVRDGVALQLPAPATPAVAGASGVSPASATPSQQRRAGAAAPLSAAVLEHDERLAYSTDELLGLQQSPAAAGEAAAQLRAQLPQDLCSP